MEFNSVRIQTDGGRQFVRIPDEYRMNAERVFIYKSGSGIVITPVNAYYADEIRKTAKWVEEHGYDRIPPLETDREGSA